MELLTPAWTKFRPHPEQCKLWVSKERFVAVPAGRGSGKTELAKRRLVRFLPIKKPHTTPRYFYGAPTVQQARRIAWDHFLQLIPKDWIEGEPNKTTLVIKTVFGSELHIIGLDKPQRIEGDQWDGGVLDESCDLHPGTFDRNIYPMLVHRNGWCWRIGVPKRHGPSATEFRKFFEAARAGEIEDATGFTWPSSDILPESALRYAQQNMDVRDYREQFGALWQSSGGVIFHGFNVEYNVRACTYDSTRLIIVGSDFNVDPMAWVLGHKYIMSNGQARMEWFDELYIRDTNTPATLNTLWQKYSSHEGGWAFYGDATGQARKTSASKSDYEWIFADKNFERAGRTIHYPKANPARADRWATCNAMLLNGAGIRRMFIDPRCKHLIDDLKIRSQVVTDSHDIGHISDAMGYAVHYMFPIFGESQGTSEITIMAGS